MKYTLNDIKGASYVIDPGGNKVVLTIPYNIDKGNVYAIISATDNKVLYQLTNPAETITVTKVTGNEFDENGNPNTPQTQVYDIVFEADISTATIYDDFVFIMDLPMGTGNAVADNMEALTDAMFELISRLGYLGAVRGSVNDLRTTILSGVITTVTTVTTVATVTNIGQIGAMNATPMIPSVQNTLVAIGVMENITF